MYLLDTNICIYAMKNKYPNINKKIFSINSNDIVISSVTVGELEYGAAKSQWGECSRNALNAFLANYEIISFNAYDAVYFCQIRAALALKGLPIGFYDVMIAAQGVARNFTVVTHNTKEFSRIPGLIIEDWV